jgi:peptide chain release factor subunit 1
MSNTEIASFKIKRLIQYLNQMKGNGTSCITLIIPPEDQISKSSKLLTDELGAASNIKSRVNRQSVLTAITSCLQKLKNYTNKAPKNGLVLFCGEIICPDGKEKKINIDYIPFKPISGSGYICDSSFHTDCLQPLLQSDDQFGFIIMDGSGCCYAMLQSNNKSIINQFSVDLPKKHGRGGQSAVRFGRLREEAYGHYIRKCSELATQCFIKNDVPNVKGIILAGCANFKNKLYDSNLFDPRLKSIVIKIIDISYGGENGLNQAIQATGDVLSMVKINQERKVLTDFFTEISKDTNKYVFGCKEVMDAIDARSIEKVICYENYEGQRYTLKNGKIVYKQPTTEVIDTIPIIDWLADNYQEYSFELIIVSDKSEQGTQFVKGFGGIGGILRYPMELDFSDVSENEDDFI